MQADDMAQRIKSLKMKKDTNNYTKKQNDVLELISHLILTKPDAVEKLLYKHGVVFPFQPKRKHLINEVVEMLKEQDPRFNKDLDRLISTHLKNKGMEIIVLESHKILKEQNEDQFLGGLVGGLAKGAIGGLSSLFGKKKSRGGGGNNQAAQLQAQRMKAQMDAKMRQMEEDKRRMREENERRRREEEERRRRKEEEDRRRRREEEDRKRREEEDRRRKDEASKSGGKSNTNLMIMGGLAFLVVVGGLVAVGMKKSA